MGLNDFIINGRVGTFDKLTAKQTLNVGNQSIYTNQGTSYFVDSGSGSSSNTGKSWAHALDTIDNAINKCTANQGDRIIIAEGHSESYTTTGAKAVFDVAGITVVCLGQGSDRPTFSFGHTGATWTISAANIKIYNALFVTAIDSVVTYGTISGADCALIGCESRDVTDKEVITDFTITGDRFTALRYFKNGYTSGNANDAVFSMAGVDNSLIQDCIFMTKVLTAVVEFVTTACTNVVVKNCEFYVSGTTDFSKTVVDTITGSEWEVNSGFDLGAGSKFSGGSGAALAGDDVSAVSTAVAALQADVGNPSARTNLQTIEAMLGNPDTAAQSIWDALAGAGGLAAFPAAAAAANDVSLAEVIRYIQETCLAVPTQDLATDALTAQVVGKKSDTTGGTSLVSLVKIADAAVDALQADVGNPSARTNLQTIEAMLGNPDTAAQSLWDLLAGSGGIASFPAAAAPANDVSLAEVIRDIWDSLRNGTGGSEPATNLSIVDEIRALSPVYNNKNYLAVTADFTSATWNTVATHELFTVTGLVRMKVIAEVTGNGAGATATIELGNEGDTDLWIPTTTITDMVDGEIWADATPTEVDGNFSSLVFDKVVNDVDIGYEIKTAAATGGSIVFHCWWEPINSTGAVAAGDGSALV